MRTIDLQKHFAAVQPLNARESEKYPRMSKLSEQLRTNYNETISAIFTSDMVVRTGCVNFLSFKDPRINPDKYRGVSRRMQDLLAKGRSEMLPEWILFPVQVDDTSMQLAQNAWQLDITPLITSLGLEVLRKIPHGTPEELEEARRLYVIIDELEEACELVQRWHQSTDGSLPFHANITSLWNPTILRLRELQTA